MAGKATRISTRIGKSVCCLRPTWFVAPSQSN